MMRAVILFCLVALAWCGDDAVVDTSFDCQESVHDADISHAMAEFFSALAELESGNTRSSLARLESVSEVLPLAALHLAKLFRYPQPSTTCAL